MVKILCIIGGSISVLGMFFCTLLFIFGKGKDKNGNRLELYNQTDNKPWGLGVWMAGVFAAASGVSLMYTYHDLITYQEQGLNPFEASAMLVSFNGFPFWSLFALVGLWYMNHMDSKIGKIAAIASTVVGMATSLWVGTKTILSFLGYEIPGLRFLIAAIIILVALWSVKYDKLKFMSKAAFIVFIIAMLVVYATPREDFVYRPVTGGITKEFWKQFFYDDLSASWWFWSFSWVPTVSRWLAHISKGRTMREYLTGTLILPTVLAIIWTWISYTRQDVIIGFNLKNDLSLIIPCSIFMLSGILFMSSTLDSDCKVFTEDLEYLIKGKIKRKKMIPFYGFFVIFVYCLYISGTISNPFNFNEFSSPVFIPLFIWAFINSYKLVKKYIKGEKVNET